MTSSFHVRHAVLLTGLLLGSVAVLSVTAPLVVSATGSGPAPASRATMSDDLGASQCAATVVDAPVSATFRLPRERWGSGNRGLTYSTVPATPVRAAQAGQVTFAGLVARRLYVTVHQRDGLRVSYSYLADVDVRAGDSVGRGQVIGHTGSTFHLGVRRGEAYLDPALLWSSCRGGHAVLVPVGDPVD